MTPPRPRPDPQGTLDLHGLRPEQALRRVEQELHTARVLGRTSLTIITGQGRGNALWKPILRDKVEAFLRLEGPRLWVLDVRHDSHGGALLVRLEPRG